MRRFILSVLAAGASLAGTAPAAAQDYRPPYGASAGSWGEARGLSVRIETVRQQIERLDQHDAITARSADRLMHEANQIDRRLRDKARNGLDPREAGDIRYRLQRLEQRVHWASGPLPGRLGPLNAVLAIGRGAPE